MNDITVAAINQRLRQDAAAFVGDAEAQYLAQLKKLADELIAGGEERPVILLSGPSGSGKTTTAMRLEMLLDAAGHNSHTISMDNYFLPRSAGKMPRNEVGELDLESPLRVDIPLLTAQLQQIYRCEQVEVPTFIFPTQSRGESFPLRRALGDFIILEGIHTLNPLVTGEIANFANTVYISVETGLCDDDGDRLQPAMIRLARRIIRDTMFRGKTPADTMTQFASVSRGEVQYIQPFKKHARFTLDTFFAYEMSAYRNRLLSELHDLAALGNTVAGELEQFLLPLESLNNKLIPGDSLIREFIAGGTMHYR